jgi:uncharacterized protein (DUF1697 family)
MNAKMPDLRRAFERAGFTNVVTVISSGNVVFDAPRTSARSLEKKAEAAMQEHLGTAFLTIIRSVDELNALLARDPFTRLRLPPSAKRIVTFLRAAPSTRLPLPIEWEGATIHALDGREIFSSYVPSPKGAAFMVLIEKTFGTAVTTRTWDTVRKIAAR